MSGILDVSGNNGAVDFTKVKAAWYQGVYVKATEGGTFTDPLFGRNIIAVHGVGLDYGPYHYGHPGSQTPPEGQADFLVAAFASKGLPLLYPYALDIETVCWDGTGTKPAFAATNCHHPTQSPAAVRAWVKAFGDRLRLRSGRDWLLYTYSAFLKGVLTDAGVPAHGWLWQADYSGAAPESRAILHQYTDAATVPGLTGKFDASTVRVSPVAYQLLAGRGLETAAAYIGTEISNVIKAGVRDILGHQGLA